LWSAVVRPDVVLNREDEVAHAAQGAAPNAFPGDLGKPAFDLIEPRRTGGRKVQRITRSPGQSLLHLWMLVGSVVIEHQMDVQSRINGLINATEEAQELLVRVAGMALGNNGPLKHVERREQRSRSMTLLVVRLAFRQPRSQRKNRLGRLQLTLAPHPVGVEPGILGCGVYFKWR